MKTGLRARGREASNEKPRIVVPAEREKKTVVNRSATRCGREFVQFRSESWGMRCRQNISSDIEEGGGTFSTQASVLEKREEEQKKT